MNNFLNTYIKSSYLYETAAGGKYEAFYLYLSVFLLVVILAVRIYLFLKKGRAGAYKRFDQLWFWGYFSLGLAGLFIWFSRTQLLPMFSTRIVSYLWLLGILVLKGYLIFYYFRILPARVTKYYEKARKTKYLGK
jgi:hypothetical protein